MSRKTEYVGTGPDKSVPQDSIVIEKNKAPLLLVQNENSFGSKIIILRETELFDFLFSFLDFYFILFYFI